jgi:hypothetical protein
MNKLVRLRVSSAQAIVEDCLRAVALFAVFAIASITVLLSAIMVLNVHPLTAFLDDLQSTAIISLSIYDRLISLLIGCARFHTRHRTHCRFPRWLPAGVLPKRVTKWTTTNVAAHLTAPNHRSAGSAATAMAIGLFKMKPAAPAEFSWTGPKL